ncbi:MAG TPA: WD40 repeat domain-containing protein, partial [Gemmataceae bacterium]|nr:WD40 repeat domain-containing protein [Gemmataceae bacterium]
AVDLNDQVVTLRDWPSGQVRQSFNPPAGGFGTSAATISPDGRSVAVIGEGVRATIGIRNVGGVNIFDAATGEARARIASTDAMPAVVTALPDGSGFLVGSRTMVAPWPAGTPQPPHPSGEALILYSAATGEPVRRFIPPDRPAGQYRSVTALTVSADGHQLAAAEDDFAITVYETATGKVRHHFTGHRNEVIALAFTHDGRRLVSTSSDLTGLVWDVSQN